MSPRKEGIPLSEVKLLPGEMIFRVEMGRLRRPFPFIGNERHLENIGKDVVVETEWGLDLGRLDSAWAEPDKNILGKIVYLAGEAEKARMKANQAEDEACKRIFENSILELSLPMKLVGIEHSLELKKVTFYYEAEQRVDFRKLVKLLASRLRRRIELYQLSEKDRFLFYPIFGSCGRRLCCQRDPEWFARKVPSRCAKVQDLAHNLEKVQGVCGKMKCCLLYELEAYEEFYGLLVRKGGSYFLPKRESQAFSTCGECKFRAIDWNVPLGTVTLAKVTPKPSDGKEEAPEAESVTVSFDELKKDFVKVQ